jgi:death on curing protein
VTEPVWLRRDVILAVHDEQLADHGGAQGLRDEGLLDSALARPHHLLGYGDPDAAELGAAYAWGIARNHPLVDGNKRTALVAAELFLVLNGYELQADDADCVVTMLKVAAGEMAEDDFAAWIRGHIRRRG